MTCTGNSQYGHCCWLGTHGECVYLEKNTVSGRRYVCGLRRELGSWDQVHMSDRYLTGVKPKLVEIGIREDCGDWPDRERQADEPAKWLCCYGDG